jgi:hypothetical protein
MVVSRVNEHVSNVRMELIVVDSSDQSKLITTNIENGQPVHTVGGGKHFRDATDRGDVFAYLCKISANATRCSE